MKRFTLKTLSLLAGVVLLQACGSATTGTDNSTSTRDVTGNLTSSTPSALTRYATTGANCSADSIVATDTSGLSTTASIDENCDFSLSLSVGKSYSIGFVLNNNFVASLTYSGGSGGFALNHIPLVNGNGAINLGAITISGNTAIPTNNPLESLDSDDDGIPDYEDTDDDNDGTEDELEADCDFDGVIDDFDDDSDNCAAFEDDGTTARILEVRPRADHDDDGVDVDKKVRARIACQVDQSTVTADTFAVTSEDGTDIIECTYTFSDTDKIFNQLRCEHDNAPFLTSTTYTATIDGILCQDGREVEVKSWSWTTEAEDDDDSDYEDEFEDSEDGDRSDDDSDDDSSDDDDSNDSSDDDSNDDDGDDSLDDNQ